jgi:hypothetical protein
MWQALIAAKSSTIATCRLLATLVMVVSFALPAVRIPADAHWNSPTPAGDANSFPQSATAQQQPLTLRGIHCAVMSLFGNLFIFRSSASERRNIPFWMYLAAVSGWTNLLVVAYFPFGFSERRFKLRFSLSVAIALCLAASVILFVTSPIAPLLGYFLWVSGILIIVFPFAETL